MWQVCPLPCPIQPGSPRPAGSFPGNCPLRGLQLRAQGSDTSPHQPSAGAGAWGWVLAALSGGEGSPVGKHWDGSLAPTTWLGKPPSWPLAQGWEGVSSISSPISRPLLELEVGTPAGLGTGLGMGLDGCRGEPDSPKSWLRPTDWPQPPPIFLLAWGRHRPSCSKLGPAITTDPEQRQQQDGHHPAQGCFLPAQQCPNLLRDLEALPPLSAIPHPPSGSADPSHIPTGPAVGLVAGAVSSGAAGWALPFSTVSGDASTCLQSQHRKHGIM